MNPNKRFLHHFRRESRAAAALVLLLSSACSANNEPQPDARLRDQAVAQTRRADYEKAQAVKAEAISYVNSMERNQIIKEATITYGSALVTAIKEGVLPDRSAYKFTPFRSNAKSQETWGNLEQHSTSDGTTRQLELVAFRNKQGELDPSRGVLGLRIANQNGDSIRFEGPGFTEERYGGFTATTNWEVGLRHPALKDGPEQISSTTEGFVKSREELQTIEEQAVLLLDSEVRALGIKL